MSQSSTYGSGGGGGGTPIITINGDIGSVSGSVVSFNGIAAGSSVTFNGALTTMLLEVTDSDGNTIVGNGAGNALISGTTNTSLGKDTLSSLTSGDDNIAIGNNAMNKTTAGSNNIVIGGGLSNLEDLGSNNIIIGQTGPSVISGTSNKIIISSGFSDSCYIGGINGVSLGNTATVVTMGGADPDQLGTANIIAGSGISITPTANFITIAATGAGSFAWSVITANQTAAVNHGYICNKAGTLALALPATSAVGDVIEVTNENTALGIQFTQAAGQQILIGSSSTTLGAAGTLTSSAVGDSLRLVCKTANTVWRVTSGWGNWSPA